MIQPADKKVLLVSHDSSMTGAPLALLYLAEDLAMKGYAPLIISPKDGDLVQSICDAGVPYITFPEVYTSDLVYRMRNAFEFIVVCTNVGGPLIQQLSGTNTQVLWWIHEADASYHPGALQQMPDILCNNIIVYCAGQYASKMLYKYKPNYRSSSLLYRLPDFTNITNPQFTISPDAAGKTVFAVVGSLEKRKAQDIAVEAIRMLPPDQFAQSFFIFVGKNWDEGIYQSITDLKDEFPNNISYYDFLSRSEIMDLYQQIDCLICSSLDDPMPIVVTEAQMFRKPVICSENTGSAALIEEMGSGIVYSHNSPELLKEGIVTILNDKALRSTFGENGRRTYEKYFSEEAFSNSVAKIITNLEDSKTSLPTVDGKVSVIIPTYNAEKDLSRLLAKLRAQKFIPELEIVVVDSGSADQTVKIAEDFSCKVLSIKQSDFSHSYARNLGAHHSSGKYLLFMTQDAYPGSDDWLFSMLSPILSQSAVAVSCCEHPRPDADLLGRLNGWQHSDYMDIIKHDRLLCYPADLSFDSLRKNAQLNDVACLIRRDIFMNYRYRGNYAEDLDFGIRLINDGYKLALLSSAYVIHSHNRQGYYYLKRCLVDNINVKRIMPDMPTLHIAEDQYINLVVTAHAAMLHYVSFLQNTAFQHKESESFKNHTIGFFEQQKGILSACSKEEFNSFLLTKCDFVDSQLQSFVQQLYKYGFNSFTPDTMLLNDLSHVLSNNLLNYFHFSGETLDFIHIMQISEFIPKFFAEIAGTYLAYYHIDNPNTNSFLNSCVTDLIKGV